MAIQKEYKTETTDLLKVIEFVDFLKEARPNLSEAVELQFMYFAREVQKQTVAKEAKKQAEAQRTEFKSVKP